MTDTKFTFTATQAYELNFDAEFWRGGSPTIEGTGMATYDLNPTRYEVVIMHEDDHNERKQFDTLAEAVQFMEKEAGAPCVCLPIEPEPEKPE